MKALLFALLLLPALPALAQKKSPAAAPIVRYELRGVVTYFFNSNFGNRPDAGAKAFIIKESLLKAKEPEITALETYLANHDYVEHQGHESESKLAKMPDEMTDADKIKALQEDALATEQEILNNPSTSEVTADGSGVFAKKLAPANYVVLIRSANRMRINPLETKGQLVVRRISIKDDDKEVSANFNP